MTKIRLALAVSALLILIGDVSRWGVGPSALMAQPGQGRASQDAQIPERRVFTLTGGDESPTPTLTPEILPSDFHLTTTVLPLQGVSQDELDVAVAAGSTIPIWSYTTTSSRDGQTYSGVMVGANPFVSPSSTTVITAVIFAVTLKMADGGVFDPTAPDPCLAPPLTNMSDVGAVELSPIFQNHAYTMNGIDVGNTQYVDAFQRASFWNALGGGEYHTLLSFNEIVTVTVQVGISVGRTIPPGVSGRCGNVGILDLSTFDTFVRQTLLPSIPYTVDPTVLPVLVLSNVVLCAQPNFAGCGVAGYHAAVPTSLQTYAVADFDTTGLLGPLSQDTAVLTHEIAEWMDDPLGTNRTPPWGGTGQVMGGCQGNLEVGDPLSGTSLPPVVMQKGYAYHVQELAFFSWFFGEPSLGAGGLFSNNGSFTRNALPCPPGGSGSIPLPTTWQLVGLGDLDGDSKVDVVWRNAQTGDVAAWLMNGTMAVREPVIAVGVPLVWQIVGLGDVDGDGKTDLIWRQTQTGDVAVWLMNGSTVTQGPVIAPGVPLAWQIAGLGDLDGDGKTDLIWRQVQTGDVAAWLMNGAAVKQGPVIAPGVPLAWQIAGVRDLDGDGKADLVWRQIQSGDVAAWLMNGVQVKQGPVIAPGVPLAWQIVGVRDLDGDGKADLVWRQTQTGDVAAWLLDGVTVRQGPVVSAGVPLVWQIAGLGDLDGDGKVDLIWRQTQTGDVATWLMNGVTVKNAPIVNASKLP